MWKIHQGWNDVSILPMLFWDWNEVVFESWNNIEIPARKQYCFNVETTFFQPENNIVPRLKSWRCFNFQNNCILMLFERWNMTLFQHWSNIILPTWRFLSLSAELLLYRYDKQKYIRFNKSPESTRQAQLSQLIKIWQKLIRYIAFAPGSHCLPL